MKAVQAYEQPAQRLKLKSKDSIIHFAEGLIGFAECKDFMLMENEGLMPFRVLQSVEMPNVSFLVLDPTALVNHYTVHVPARDWESIDVTDETKPLAFVIVVIGSTPETSTANLQAPLLVNYDKMIG